VAEMVTGDREVIARERWRQDRSAR
jgi:hypothetical protein